MAPLLDRLNRVSPQTAIVAVATIAAFWLRLGTITLITNAARGTASAGKGSEKL